MRTRGKAVSLATATNCARPLPCFARLARLADFPPSCFTNRDVQVSAGAGRVYLSLLLTQACTRSFALAFSTPVAFRNIVCASACCSSFGVSLLTHLNNMQTRLTLSTEPSASALRPACSSSSPRPRVALWRRWTTFSMPATSSAPGASRRCPSARWSRSSGALLSCCVSRRLSSPLVDLLNLTSPQHDRPRRALQHRRREAGDAAHRGRFGEAGAARTHRGRRLARLASWPPWSSTVPSSLPRLPSVVARILPPPAFNDQSGICHAWSPVFEGELARMTDRARPDLLEPVSTHAEEETGNCVGGWYAAQGNYFAQEN